jgi:hypothetical protein
MILTKNEADFLINYDLMRELGDAPGLTQDTELSLSSGLLKDSYSLDLGSKSDEKLHLDVEMCLDDKFSPKNGLKANKN